MWLVFLLGGSILGIWLDLRLWPAWWGSLAWHLISALLGLGLFRLVVRISRVTGRWLARCGRAGDLPRMETNRLVVVGPYACMRHPMHLGLMLFPLAFALVLGSPAFVLILAPLEALVIVGLVFAVEEREARIKFGGDYAAYASRVPPFNLSPDCLRRLLTEPPANPDCSNPFKLASE
ncbi:MAG TPA: isoprenylcysteine carboxylmethyltransferase family protein [Oceanithermus profundus]|uniref:Isoprenylcysteine carboxylmethyltransferase family protein n=1 Tax=Oceanithermus profundus TaxID=187137 RepID=A0A7C4Z6K0_9DEIN|nr:isoprenylcysteine carboxylmethyltransferase family protein [Oceanithermus profundus]